jgi:Tfp pilus assembly protein PilF
MSRFRSSEVVTFDRPWAPRVGTGTAVRSILVALVPAVLVLVTFAVFSGALLNGFVEWDDGVLIIKNEHYRGLGAEQLTWMFSNVMMGHYVPVTWLSLGTDYVLWGMDPAGYHFTNVVLHAANVALFFLVALRLLTAASSFSPPMLALGATAAALFFGLHPLRAESVAWVTERRDVLSGFFFFLTLLLYLQARDLDGRARVRRHAMACVCFTLAFLSKSMVMTLPAVLILLDIYPFRRLGVQPRTWLRRDIWWEKVPYIALGLIAAMLGYWAQAANRFITSGAKIPWSARPSFVAHSLWFYVWKTALPFDLSPLYELPATFDVMAPRFVIPVVVVLVATIALVVAARRWPAGLAVAVAYAVTLGPVSGIVHSGHQLTHDRYSYLPCLGWALLVGAGIAAVGDAGLRGRLRPALTWGVMAAFAGWIAALSFLTSHQVATWRDNETLWTYAVESTPGCSVCELNLGTTRLNQNQFALALDNLERALAARPDREKGYNNLGLAFARQGALDRAIGHFRRAVEGSPNDPSALMNLGVALMKLGRPAEGLVYLKRAEQASPDDVLIAANLATALVEVRREREAIAMLGRAIEQSPTMAQPRYALVGALFAAGEMGEARRQHAFLRVVDPGAANFVGPALLERW